MLRSRNNVLNYKKRMSNQNLQVAENKILRICKEKRFSLHLIKLQNNL